MGCIFLNANEYLFKKKRPLERGRLTGNTGNDDQIQIVDRNQPACMSVHSDVNDG